MVFTGFQSGHGSGRYDKWMCKLSEKLGKKPGYYPEPGLQNSGSRRIIEVTSRKSLEKSNHQYVSTISFWESQTYRLVVVQSPGPSPLIDDDYSRLHLSAVDSSHTLSTALGRTSRCSQWIKPNRYIVVKPPEILWEPVNKRNGFLKSEKARVSLVGHEICSPRRPTRNQNIWTRETQSEMGLKLVYI